MLKDKRIISKELKKARESQHLTIETVAEMTGFSTGTIKNLENPNKNCHLENIIQYASNLGLSPVIIFDSNDINKYKNDVQMQRKVDINLWNIVCKFSIQQKLELVKILPLILNMVKS